MKGYIRLIPKDEANFFEKVGRYIRRFSTDEGIAWKNCL